MTGNRSSTRTVIAYSVLRLLMFAVPFLVIWALSGNPTLSAVLAAVIGLALSVVLLDPQRGAMVGVLSRRAERRRPQSDEAAEDRVTGTASPRSDGGQSDSAAARPKP